MTSHINRIQNQKIILRKKCGPVEHQQDYRWKQIPSSTNRTNENNTEIILRKKYGPVEHQQDYRWKMDWLHPDHKESAGAPTELKDQISWYPNRVLTNKKNDIGWCPSRVERLNQLVSQPSRPEKNKEWAEQFQPIVKLWAEQIQPIAQWNMGGAIPAHRETKRGRINWADQLDWGTWHKKEGSSWRFETWGAWWGACSRRAPTGWMKTKKEIRSRKKYGPVEHQQDYRWK